MFKTPAYALHFVLMSFLVFMVQGRGAALAEPTLISLVALFILTHMARITFFSTIVGEAHSKQYKLFKVLSRSCIPLVSTLYVASSVAVLVTFDYTLLAAMLASSYAVAHVLFKHYELTYGQMQEVQ